MQFRAFSVTQILENLRKLFLISGPWGRVFTNKLQQNLTDIERKKKDEEEAFKIQLL